MSGWPDGKNRRLKSPGSHEGRRVHRRLRCIGIGACVGNGVGRARQRGKRGGGMILPNNEECVRVTKELEDCPDLTQWEADFIDSNRGRTAFTDKQKEVFASLLEKYEV